jgi:hypothetical protein
MKGLHLGYCVGFFLHVLFKSEPLTSLHGTLALRHLPVHGVGSTAQQDGEGATRERSARGQTDRARLPIIRCDRTAPTRGRGTRHILTRHPYGTLDLITAV